MSLLRSLALMLLFLAPACATTPPPQPTPLYFVVRHLHTPAGVRDPDLLEEGRRQAILLADRFGADRPAAIYVSHFRRSQQTAAPLAERTGLTAIVYDPADTPGLVARVKAGPQPSLIVGHSNTVPDIVEQLGGTRPPALVHEDFGDIWRIEADGSTRRMRIAENAE